MLGTCEVMELLLWDWRGWKTEEVRIYTLVEVHELHGFGLLIPFEDLE